MLHWSSYTQNTEQSALFCNPSIVLQSSAVAIAEVLNYKTALSSYIPSIAKMKSGVRILVAQFRTVCSICSCSSVESTRSPSVNNTMAVRVKVGNVVVECIEWSQDHIRMGG